MSKESKWKQKNIGECFFKRNANHFFPCIKSNNSGVEQKESNYRELFDKCKKCSEQTCNKQFDIYAEQGIPV